MDQLLKGAVSPDLMHLKGPAKVFNSEEEVNKLYLTTKWKEGDILVIEYEGPKGGPGMREMLNPTYLHLQVCKLKM